MFKSMNRGPTYVSGMLDFNMLWIIIQFYALRISEHEKGNPYYFHWQI